MNFVWCVPCSCPEWKAYWGRHDFGWYAGITLGRFHVEVNG